MFWRLFMADVKCLPLCCVVAGVARTDRTMRTTPVMMFNLDIVVVMTTPTVTNPEVGVVSGVPVYPCWGDDGLYWDIVASARGPQLPTQTWTIQIRQTSHIHNHLHAGIIFSLKKVVMINCIEINMSIFTKECIFVLCMYALLFWN